MLTLSETISLHFHCIVCLKCYSLISEIDICDSNPCQNSGNCSQNNGEYVCACVAGYTGHSCETG